MVKKYIVILVLMLAVTTIVITIILKNSNKMDVKANAQQTQETVPSDTPQPTPVSTTLADGLIIEDMKVGQGKEVKKGDIVSMHYKGTLLNGSKFDSSYDRNQPFETVIGVGQVIKGWDEGVPGMKVGGKRKLTIPAALGYGNQTVSTIPANSVLVFEVELLEIK